MTSRRLVLVLALAAVGLVALAVLVTISVMSVVSQKPNAPSDAALFVFDTNDVLEQAGHQWAWNDDVHGALSSTDPRTRIGCPAGSTNVAAFIATSGNERTPAAWATWEFFGYGVSKDSNRESQSSVLMPPLTPDRMGSGGGQAIQKSGGTFSLGIACTTNNNLTATAAYYRTIHVEAGGIWTIDPVR